MTSIQIDDQTAQGPQALAAANGLTLEVYLRELLAKQVPLQQPPISPAEFDAELESLSIDGPSLPADFSRADIYADHD